MNRISVFNVPTARSLVRGVVCLVCGVACGDDADKIAPDRTVHLTFSDMGGFDDFGSGGAALGIGIDDTNDMALVVALRFRLPLYQDDFAPSTDVNDTLNDYRTATAVAPIQAMVTEFPALASAIINTAGLRNMGHEMTVFLLEGVIGTNAPSSVFVADDGEITLVRDDNPTDSVTGALRFREVTGVGDVGNLVDQGEVIALEQIDLTWNAELQP